MATKLNKSGNQQTEIGTEHIIADYGSGTASQRWFSMWLDCNAMQTSDILEVRIYVVCQSAGSLRLYRKDTISNAQAEPAWYMAPLPNRYGFRISLKQTGGTARSYPYLIFEQ